MGSLSETSVTAVRQGIRSGKLNSLIYMGEMEGIRKKKWHRTVHMLWWIPRRGSQQDRSGEKSQPSAQQGEPGILCRLGWGGHPPKPLLEETIYCY